jgi:sodium-dependent phosphate transporter
MWDEYRWIIVVGAFLAVFTAYGIGANDLANAFGSSVGSKALTIKQAVLVAAVFEFLGAFLLGSHVTETVRKGIADPAYFYATPELYMYGMLSVIAATGMWLLLATYFELPVSTTHSAVGGVIGFAMTAAGSDAVIWYKEGKSGEFPIKGVAGIVLSWVLSPVCCAILSASFFWGARYFVLEHENSYERSFWAFPVFVFLAVFVNCFFIINKGAKALVKKDSMFVETGNAAWLSVCIAVGMFIISAIFSKFYLKQVVEADLARQEAAAAKKAAGGDEVTTKTGSFFKSLSKGLDQDVHAVVHEDEDVGAVHEFTTVYDHKTEESFKYLQVFTAICDSFSHGANDVANSVGPFAGMYLVYKMEYIPTKSKTELIDDDMWWILALGGVGIILGLSTYGYIIMRAIGVKLSKITPSRGFAIELGSAFIVALGSKYGLPLSTTHCQVGSTIGVGLLEGSKGVNWMIVPKIIMGWIITLIVVAFTTSLLFSQGAYAPNVFLVREKIEMRFYVQSYAQEYATRAKAYLATTTPPTACPTCDLVITETERMFNNKKVQKVNQDIIGYTLCKVNEIGDLLTTTLDPAATGLDSTYGTTFTTKDDTGATAHLHDLKGNFDFCTYAKSSITTDVQFRENTCSGGCANF